MVPHRRKRRGQSATEFALMIPLIFGMLFAVIEYSYYFGAVHYTNYVAFVGARAVQADESDPDAAMEQLMTGNVTSSSGDKSIQNTVGQSSVTSKLSWEAETPFFKDIMQLGGSTKMDVEMEVVLGRNESYYELKSDPLAATHSDNCLAEQGGCL